MLHNFWKVAIGMTMRNAHERNIAHMNLDILLDYYNLGLDVRYNVGPV